MAAARAATIAPSKKTARARTRTVTSKVTIAEAIEVEAIETEAAETARRGRRASGCQEDPPSGAQLGAALRLTTASWLAPIARAEKLK